MKRVMQLKLSSLLLLCVFLLAFPSFASSQSLCARVKIEIRQELTLERQAFDAHMRINNGLDNISLENVAISVNFQDEDGNSVYATSDSSDTEAIFFIRVDSLDNIDAIDGTGTVLPSTSADINWLIIPAPGASNGLPQGTLYYVGATLSYTLGGEEQVTEVSPDYIYVKPMPELTLDYFLPAEVYGDDAFTEEIEPEIPFSLGVRVMNNGYGAARNLKIESAQPEIVENERGLLIGFEIVGSEVNGQPATNSLLVDFGDIDPGASGVGRWIMTCSLSGRFVEFTAQYSHSDELGGELTSLLQTVITHLLVHDVIVDLPGRDDIKDFLALDSDVMRVYESESLDTDVTDQSGLSGLQFVNQSGSETIYTLSTPLTSGLMYLKLSDPHLGTKVIEEVFRSDGKRIKPENAWLSKTRNESDQWEYFFSLFDANSTESYTVIFGDPADGPQAPVLQFIPDRSTFEGQRLAFLVEASDPNGTTPTLQAAPLPVQATFTDGGDGTGIFDWTPAPGQVGRYEITFTASDGLLEASRRAVITVCSDLDTDCDGMLDSCEVASFGNLDRDGTGDFDGDGISDLEECQEGTDPTSINVPSVPVIYSPQDGTEAAILLPDLVIQNSIDPDGAPINYDYEIYADPDFTQFVAGQTSVTETASTTGWTVPALNDNAWYYWRVRASDGGGYSEWAYGSFFVNTSNDPPGGFNASRPLDGSEVDNLRPVLEVTNSLDVDEDEMTYVFEVYADSGMSTLVALSSGIQQGGGGTTSWLVDLPLDESGWYYWRAIAIDEHGAQAETIPTLSSFLVNTSNSAPAPPSISSPLSGSEVLLQTLELVVNNAADADGDSIVYFFELDKVNTFDSAAVLISAAIPEGVSTTSWTVAALEDNTEYFWRVKASDGYADSAWVNGSFFVNLANDDPSVPTLRNPGEGATVQTLTPSLVLNPVEDIDGDTINYRFELYVDPDLRLLVAEGVYGNPSWLVPMVLDDDTWYYWRAQAEDEHGAAGAWSSSAGWAFFVNDNGVDDPPEITVFDPSADMSTNSDPVVITWDDRDPDSNADIGLYYDTDTYNTDGLLIIDGLKEDSEGSSDFYLWDVSGMAEGTYYIYATIADGTSLVSVYAPGSITIDRTSPVVVADPPGGVYGSPQSVTLTADEEADIYYTTDGSDPVPNAMLLYGSAIDILDSTTLKFMAVDMAGNSSVITTAIYTITDTDTDDDGLSDAWEIQYFGDLSQDGTGDFDGDGYTNLDEYLYDTDPTDSGPPYPSSTSSVWYDIDWPYRQQITISSSMIPNTDQADFPVLIKIAGSLNPVFANAMPGGEDILFTSSDGTTILSHEIEKYDPYTAELIAWIRIPVLSASVDTDIYMYYGNAGAPAQWDINGTWDADYIMVQHLHESPDDGLIDGHLDSTFNNNHGTPLNFQATGDGTTNTVGAIDGADDFGGDDDYIEVTSSTSLKSSAVTVSAWVYADSLPRAVNYILKKGAADGYSLRVNSEGKISFYVKDTDSGWIPAETGTGEFQVGEWVHLVGTYDGSNLLLYKNGEQIGSGAPGTGGIISNDDNPLLIGRHNNMVAWWDGVIDEVCISSTARSADWIMAAYNNQKSPGSFISLDTEENMPTGTIQVNATLDGVAWSGSRISYTLTGPADLRRRSVPLTFPESPTGTYTLTYNSGGPSGAIFSDITPSDIQTLDTDGTITFTMNFVAPLPAEWHNSDWPYRQKVTISSRMTPNVDQADYPVLVKLTDPANPVFVDAQATGDDIKFTSSDGTTILSHEIEKYDPYTAELIVWIRIPVLSASVDTDIYMYYGNASAPAQWDINGTWDADYIMVQHLHESPDDGLIDGHLDSTFNNNHGTPLNFQTTGDGTTNTVGAIDGADDFGGDDDYIEVTSSTSLKPSAVTVSVWVYADSLPRAVNYILKKGAADGYSLRVNSEGKISFYVKDTVSGWIPAETGTGEFQVGEWVHLVGTYDGSNLLLYKNGEQVGIGTPVGTGVIANDDNPLLIGRHNNMVAWWDGVIDELRLSNTARSADWIMTAYNNQRRPEANVRFAAAEVAPADWPDTAWLYRQQVTIGSGMTANTDQADFPVLIEITDPANPVFVTAQPDGGDILFTYSDGTTILSHEIEKYDSSTGELIVWVRIPLLSTSDDNVIYMYYGNAGSPAQWDITGTWDVNYSMVHHLHENPDDGLIAGHLDSTLNNNHGTPWNFQATGDGTINDGTTNADGAIGGADDFGGDDDYIEVTSSTSLKSAAVTVSAWVYADSLPRAVNYILKKGAADGYSLRVSSDGKISFYVKDDSDWIPAETGVGEFQTNTWVHLVGTYDGSNLLLYKNGLQVGIGTPGAAGVIANDDNPLLIGKHNNMLAWWDGIIDEVRVSSTARNADWILTSLINQTASFISFGTEESAP